MVSGSAEDEVIIRSLSPLVMVMMSIVRMLEMGFRHAVLDSILCAVFPRDTWWNEQGSK